MAPHWNPLAPAALGEEWPGMRDISFPLVEGVEYGHTFLSRAAATIASTAFITIPPGPAGDLRLHPLVTVYQKGQERDIGRVQRTLCACTGGALVSTAALVNAATIQAALLTPADNAYVDLTGAAAVDMDFATAGLFTGKRILKLVLHYAGSWIDAPAANEIPTVLVTLIESGVYAIYGSIPLDYPHETAQPRTINLGEINPHSPAVATGTTRDRWPWTVADMTNLSNGTLRFSIQGSSGFSPGPTMDVRIDYAALEVIWCEENRLAVGGQRMGSGASASYEPGSAVGHGMTLRTPAGAANWAKANAVEYTATITAADGGGPYINSPGSDMETVGVALFIPAVDAFEVFAPHEGRVMQRSPDNDLLPFDADSRVTPLRFYNGGTTDFDPDPYAAVVPAVSATGVALTQGIEQHAAAAATPYPWVRFYARRFGSDPANLTVTVDAGVATLTAADFDAMDEIFDGWKEVTLAFASAPTVGTSGADKSVIFASAASINDRWEVLGVTAAGMVSDGATYGGSNTYAVHDGVSDTSADLAVTIHTAAPAVSGFALTQDALPVTGVGLYCGTPMECIPTGIGYVRVSWESTAITGFAYYDIERKDTIDTTFRTVGKVTSETATSWTDFEARVGISSTYRMRLCRTDDICSAYTAESSITLSSGNAPSGVLIFTSNVAPTGSAAYSQAFEGGDRTESFDFPEAEWVKQQHMYGRFGTQSFHPTERGGVRFSRDVLVNALAAPIGFADRGFSILRDLAWADVPYVCVRDDQGNRWFATLVVPSGADRRSKQLYIAQVQVIESTDVPFPSDHTI